MGLTGCCEKIHDFGLMNGTGRTSFWPNERVNLTACWLAVATLVASCRRRAARSAYQLAGAVIGLMPASANALAGIRPIPLSSAPLGISFTFMFYLEAFAVPDLLDIDSTLRWQLQAGNYGRDFRIGGERPISRIYRGFSATNESWPNRYSSQT